MSDSFLGTCFGITINGEDIGAGPGSPATVTRSFTPDGSGDPFHVTGFDFVIGTFSVDWKIGPRELGWFADGSDSAHGRYPKDGDMWIEYEATRPTSRPS